MTRDGFIAVLVLICATAGARAESADGDGGEMIGPSKPATGDSKHANLANAADDDDDDFEVKIAPPPPRPNPLKALPAIAEVASQVDAAIETDLKAMNIAAEHVCDDPAFLRRASLDLTGQIPSAADLAAIPGLSENVRRSYIIRKLLESNEYADHWASFWTTVLVGRQREGFSVLSANRLRRWLHDNLRQNTPYDTWVEQLLTASGMNPPTPAGKSAAPPQADEYGRTAAIGYLGLHLEEKGLPETVGHVTRTFLGMRMGCAQCHDHPFDKWTQQDFWKLAAFLSNTEGGPYGLNDTDSRILYGTYDPPDSSLRFTPTLPGYAMASFSDEPVPATRAPRARKPNFSGFPDSKRDAKPAPRGQLYRRELAKWVIDPLNENFDRVAVNRVWKALLGYGMVEPVDDLREKNPPTHPEAMELLAADFRNSNRDLRRLIEIVANTRAYQRDSIGVLSGKERVMQVRYAGRGEVRPMTPEMMFCAVLKVTAGEAKVNAFLKGLLHTDAYNRRTGNDDVLQFYNLLQRFEPASGSDDAAGKVQFEGTVTLALTMMHAGAIQRLIRAAVGGRAVDYLFASALCRAPTIAERADISKLHSGGDDLLWVLINTAEFVTIH